MWNKVTIPERISKVVESHAIARQIIDKLAPQAFLNSVLIDLSNERTSIEIIKFDFGFFEIGPKFVFFGPKLYRPHHVEVNNSLLCAGTPVTQGKISQSAMEKLSRFDPDSFPPKILRIEHVEIDVKKVLDISFSQPPYFSYSQLSHMTYLDISLFVHGDQPAWRVLSEHDEAGFRTIYINAITGDVIYNKLDRLMNAQHRLSERTRFPRR